MCANHICFVNSDIQLPAMEGLSAEKQTPTPHRVGESLSYFGPEMPPSAIAGLKCDTAEGIVVFPHLLLSKTLQNKIRM